MNYPRILASRTPIPSQALETQRPCPRCGLVRSARAGSLCRDCRSVLTETELRRWTA